MKKIKGNAKKLKMTQIFKQDRAIGVTPLQFDAEIELPELKEGTLIAVSGITKSHGFQGVVKRHGFHGGPKTHGQKNRYRAPGSIGSTAPQRVVPGKKMAGRMGGVRVTVKNLSVADVDTQKKILFVEGSVPGTNHSRVLVHF